MAEKSCRPAFSLPFHGLSGTRQVDFSNEVPDQFDLLPAMAAGLVRRMDDDLLYKLIDDGGRQFPDAHIFSHNGCKAGKIGLILFKGFYCVPPCLDLLRQFFLFCLIVGGEFQEPFMADRTADVVLINAFENPVKFANTLFRLGDFAPALLGLFFGFLEVLLFATSSNAIASSKNSAATSKIRCKTNSFSVSSRIKCMVQSPVLLLYREHR